MKHNTVIVCVFLMIVEFRASKLANHTNIMAAVRLIGSLYIWSEAGAAAGQGWGGCGQKAVRRAPGSTQGKLLEGIGESRARQAGEPARARKWGKGLRHWSPLRPKH